MESLASPEMKFFFRHFNEGVEALSPASRLFITQIGLEPLLRRSARERGAEHAYATELISLEQDDDGVTAFLRPRDGGASQTVRADYLVAADGAHSPVRKRCGTEMAGRGAFADCVTIYFRADMRELIGDRNLSVVYVNHPELLGFFRFSITGDSGFLAVFSTINPDGTKNTAVGETMDTAWATELVGKRTRERHRDDQEHDDDELRHRHVPVGPAEVVDDPRAEVADDEQEREDGVREVPERPRERRRIAQEIRPSGHGEGRLGRGYALS